MKRLILFLEPTAAQLNIFTQFTLPRLGSFILAGLTAREPGWRAKVFIEGRRSFRLQSWIAANGRPEVVGISTITPSATRCYALADECRALGIPVLMGGPHASFMPEEALGHADWIVRGEGEHAMKALLDLWRDGLPHLHEDRLSAIPNLSWKDQSGKVRHNPLAPWLDNLDALPYPDFSLADGTADCRIGRKNTVSVQTSRGCPFDCSFCSVTGMFGKKFRFRSVPSVIDELGHYASPNHFVFFCDDNFTANKAHARELVEALIREDFRFQWSTQVRADLARDPELVRRMKLSGCHTVFVGFESVNPRSLAEMKKRQNLDDIRNCIRVIQAAGIHIHGMFVFGFDEDRWNTIESTIRFIREMRLTSVQLLILTPLPGSELYDRLSREGRITSTDWNLYDTHHVVFRPAGLTPFELQYAQLYGHTRLYALKECLRKALSGSWVSATLSFYAWRINRRWHRRNRGYLRTLEAAAG